ncbi:hypothetical protein Clacol_009631 [Clathrus columnatus]|uniref:CENP-V/GFA domain-containing protein n=1 Tax=Clathrus columnatus TaxID=1419009 RepID=A0AAV5ATY7_9AGAM|nr:hypothetical protein Clacol_009631 [Clathrus columnatus]
MGWPSFLPFRDASTPRKWYDGACHCGKFQFTFQHPIVEDGFEVLTCNCSICTAKGALYVYIPDPAVDFKFTKGSLKELAEYRFDRKAVGHLFCGSCGSNLLEDILLGEQKVIAVNARFIKGIDLNAIKLRHLDGRSLDSVIDEAMKDINAP